MQSRERYVENVPPVVAGFVEAVLSFAGRRHQCMPSTRGTIVRRRTIVRLIFRSRLALSRLVCLLPWRYRRRRKRWTATCLESCLSSS